MMEAERGNTELPSNLCELLARQEFITPAGNRIGTNSRSTVNNLRLLHHLLSRTEPTKTLEIGLALGTSAMLFADHHREYNGGGKHVAIDPFQFDVWGGIAYQHLKEFSLDQYVEIIIEPWRSPKSNAIEAP